MASFQVRFSVIFGRHFLRDSVSFLGEGQLQTGFLKVYLSSVLSAFEHYLKFVQLSDRC